MILWLVGSYLPVLTGAWNSFGTQAQLYTFQEFYSDAQYGPDFGYYSTGRILHSDGPADNGSPDFEGGGDQDWFNSYTTLPMSLSPYFAHTLCDRIFSMWQDMGRPSPFVLVEFGGGTGMLARDILRRARDTHAEFYDAIVRYVIAERSKALRVAQKHTTAEFCGAGKLEVIAADAREAARIRPVLEEVVGSNPVLGIILSNELLDELDPVRLRLTWSSGQVPSSQECSECRSFREAYVFHRIDLAALRALLKLNPGQGVSEKLMNLEAIKWEGDALACGLLNTPALAQAMAAVAEDLPPSERGWCAPMLVCCLPFFIAVHHALQFRHDALDSARVHQYENNGEGPRELVRLYRHHAQRVNGTVLLSKERYREMRRLAAAHGSDMERALLVGVPPLLPGRMYSEEMFLALTPTRCKELQGWMGRHSERFSTTAHVRNQVAWVFDGDLGPLRTSMHLKIVVRPGEAEFVHQASQLIDEGFLVTLDYGADADALMWQALIRPNYEGIHIMDARHENMDECTAVSYLECPGLQDLTTSVDFTEVAQAGKMLGGWEVRAYGPIFLLELAFDTAAPYLAELGDPIGLGHLVERAGGLRTTGLQAWYRKPESDPWASFKLMVQHRGVRGAQWSLGAPSTEWPLQAGPRLLRAPSPCWQSDLTKPPLAALIASSAERAMALTGEDDASGDQDEWAAVDPLIREIGILQQHFQSVLLRSTLPLAQLIDAQHVAQQQAYSDVHLALLLVDYWRFLNSSAGVALADSEIESEVRAIAVSRRLPELYGEDVFERVLADLVAAVFNNSSLQGLERWPPYVCLAARAFWGIEVILNSSLEEELHSASDVSATADEFSLR